MPLHTIDLNSSLGEQADTMAKACSTTGFFFLPMSVIPAEIVDAAWIAAREFFALPEHQKRRVEFPEPGYPYGYSPLGFESLARSRDDAPADATPDLKESFSVGPDCGAASGGSAARVKGSGQGWIRSQSLWPVEPAGLREAWERYYRALAVVAERLLTVMARALDLPKDYFAPLIDDPISSMRAVHYPALDSLNQVGSIRAGAHTDYGTLTILRTDDVPGLEIQRADGSWAPVESRPDCFIVNLGDSIAQWTNDQWRSTMHRVALTSSAARQSIAFFHMANWDAVIECLPTCRPAVGSPQYGPVEAGPWLMRKFQATV